MSPRGDDVTVDRSPTAVARTAPELQSYLCRCRDDEFVVVAPSYGCAWLRVMERYGAEHPGQIPQPVWMENVVPPAATPPAVDAPTGGAVSLDERTPTRRATRAQIEAALAVDAAPGGGHGGDGTA